MINERQLLGGCAVLLLSTGMAAAQSAGCAAVNGFSTPHSEFRENFTSLGFSEGEIVTLTADSIASEGGFIDGPEGGGAGIGQSAFYFVDGSRTRLSGTFFYPRPSDVVSETFVMPSGVNGLGWAEDAPAGSFYTEFTNLGVTCATVSPISFSSDVAKISVAGQQRAINGALGSNINSRFSRGGESVVTRNSVFFSTQGHTGNQQMDANAWFSVDTRAYFDGYEGYSADLTFGADFLVNTNTLLGVMLGFNASNLEDKAGNETDAEALLVGVYGAHRFSGTDIVLDGYLSYSAVDYDTGPTTIETDRILAGLRVSGSYDVEDGTVSPRASLSGTWEDFPIGAVAPVGGTNQQTLVSVGVEMAWNKPLPGTALLPYVSVDLEYGWVEEVGGQSSDFAAPRIGFGVSGEAGGGQLALSFDAGRTTSSVIDAGIGLSYEFTF
nr:autotransporter outer membrane beta-barrel domain-containing protein [uncultured Roseovarius sp.]